MERFNLNDPRQTEKALELLFSLPSEPEDSDAEPDEGAIEDLVRLDNTAFQESRAIERGNLAESPPIISVSNRISEWPDIIQLNSSNDVLRGIGEVSQIDAEEPAQSTSDHDDNSSTSSTSNSGGSNYDRPMVEEVYTEPSGKWTHNWKAFQNLPMDFHTVPTFTNKTAAREIDFFACYFDDTIFDDIVSQTNLYATQPRQKKVKGKVMNTPSANWTDVTSQELRAFIGLHILMAIHDLPQLKFYWSSDPVLNVSAISEPITSKRFKKITENIHLNNNEDAKPKGHPEYDKLFKLRPLIDALNRNFRKFYVPSKVLSVDEAMIAFKGRSSLKQFMPNKPTKRGYKVWCLADGKTGYLLKFKIYAGRENGSTEDFYLSERVVLELMEDYRGKNYTVAFDNFFTSSRLMRILRDNNIFAIGTVRSGRVNLPPSFTLPKEKKMKKYLKLGRGHFTYQTKKNVAGIKWMDNREVTILSNCINPRKYCTVTRKLKDGKKIDVTCPLTIKKYNEIMGGVDHFDQLRESYGIGRRSVKWWHRIFYFLIDACIVNAYIAFKATLPPVKKNKVDQVSFRLALARQLIDGYSSRKRRSSSMTPFLAKKMKVPEEVLLSNSPHVLNKQSKWRRCRLCSVKLNIEKRTRFSCTTCKIPLCVPKCFNAHRTDL